MREPGHIVKLVLLETLEDAVSLVAADAGVTGSARNDEVEKLGAEDIGGGRHELRMISFSL